MQGKPRSLLATHVKGKVAIGMKDLQQQLWWEVLGRWENGGHGLWEEMEVARMLASQSH